MILLATTCGLLFVAASTGWSLYLYARLARKVEHAGHEFKVAEVNRVGKWYQDRVEALEHENRQLAGQIVEGLGRPPIAMPLPPPEEQYEYAFDDTGLVSTRLDPRDYE